MHQHRTRIIVLCAFFIGLTVWSYWTTLAVMADLWSRKPEYSHGWIVPLLALYLLWEGIKGLQKDRRMPPEEAFTPSLWGIPLLAVAIGLRVFAAHYYMEWFDFLSIIPFVAGLTLLIGGWGAFRVAWAPIAYLFFMLPLPYTAEVMLRGPLREVGTVASTYAMQTLGLPAFAEGTVVVVNDVRIGVVEACSGLRMLMIFFALSTAVALLCRRPMWQRLLIVLSAAPIALIANITRITATGPAVRPWLRPPGRGRLPRPGRLADDAIRARSPRRRSLVPRQSVHRREKGPPGSGTQRLLADSSCGPTGDVTPPWPAHCC